MFGVILVTTQNAAIAWVQDWQKPFGLVQFCGLQAVDSKSTYTTSAGVCCGPNTPG